LPQAVVLAECFQAEMILLKVLVPLVSYLYPPPGVVKKVEGATHDWLKKFLIEPLNTSLMEIPFQNYNDQNWTSSSSNC
jgi:hypothetical protein